MHIESWSHNCHYICLCSAVPPCPLPVKSQEADPPDLSIIPAEYHDLTPVFRKSEALSLPPHRPYDSAIDLLPGAPLPTSRLYNISHPEQETMKKFLKQSLAAGIIHPGSQKSGCQIFLCGEEGWISEV